MVEPALFFLRCVFWLSIVYASMSWTKDAFRPADWRHKGNGAVATIDDMAHKAVAGVGEICKRDPAQCLADAARLTALIDAGAKAEASEDETDPVDTIMSDKIAPPMPVPDPRRHARVPIQTRLP